MTHSLPPLDTEDLTPWYEEGAGAKRESVGSVLFFWFSCFCIGWTIGDIARVVLP